MTKTKKMANLGLILMLVSGIIAVVGGFIYNKYSGKARSESHSEVINKQNQIGDKIDSSKKDIMEALKEEKNKPDNSTTNHLKSNDINKKYKSKTKQEKPDTTNPQVKNQVVNNAPNQGTQVVGDNTTINIGASQRILNANLKEQLPIELDKRLQKYGIEKNSLLNIFAPMDNESINFGHQIRDFLKSQGYNVWNNLSSYMGNGGLGKLDIAFKYDSTHKRLELWINTQSK